jgi:hypothetical protein
MAPGSKRLPNLSERRSISSFGIDVRAFSRTRLLRLGISLMAAGCLISSSVAGALPNSHSPCRFQSTTFEGWKAEQLFNDWVRLTFVPQLGGRLMQVDFGGHPYLFVNPRYKGQYLPPADSMKQRQWINYGGDKLWPLPEGQGEGYWPGPVSDPLDDGEYKLTVVSERNPCTLRLEGPADPSTGLQYSREISIGNDSPRISFHAVMTNATAHEIRWSMQSVTQYDTADSATPALYNHDFWAFAPLNPQSAYIDGYRVRNGLADDPSYAVHDGMFTLHWLYLENEVWLDADAGWLAIVDDSTKYGMIERFQYSAGEEYPGKASLIFYKNGAELELDDNGMPALRLNHPDETPYYMEAEVNSPMERLNPGASYALDTWWFPVRANKELKAVTSVGIVQHPFAASLTANRLQLSGSFGVFFAGKLYAHVFDPHGAESSVVELESVDPLQVAELNQPISVSPGASRVAIHLTNEQGVDCGSLGEAQISQSQKESNR